MSHHESPAPQGESSLVSKLLAIVGGTALVAGMIVEAPILAGIGALVGVGAVGSAMMSGGGKPTTPPPTKAPTDPEQPQTTAQAPDTSALQGRIEMTVGVLRVLGELSGGEGSKEAKELQTHLAGLRDGNAAADEIGSRANAANDRLVQVLAALPQQLKASVISDRNEAEWAPFKTGGAMGNLQQGISDAEAMQKRLTDAAATLSAGQDGLAAERYVLKGGGVAIVRGKDDPRLSGLLKGWRDAAKAALDAAGPFASAIGKAKTVLTESARAKKPVKDAASELGRSVDTLLALREQMPKSAEEVIAKAADIPGIKDAVQQARKAARGAASRVDTLKAGDTGELTTALTSGREAEADAQQALTALKKFEDEDGREQASGRRVYANMEEIRSMLDNMDAARRGGSNTKQDLALTEQVRAKARLTAPTLAEAVAESVELYKTMTKEIDDAIDRVAAKGTGTAKPPRFAASGRTAPTYTYALGTAAVADWGTYDAEMKTLIAEVTGGGVTLNETFELTFSAYKNHSQGARRTKAYLDAATMGGSTVMRGYFEWTLDKTSNVVTVTPIAVTEEHGPHVRVLVGAL